MQHRAVAAVILLVAVVPACTGSSDKTKPPTPTTAPSGPTPFVVVLDDTGVHVPSKDQPAGRYIVSFEDRRSHKPTGQRVALDVRPSGPEITLFSVAAGSRHTAVLLANERVVVVLDGRRQYGRPPFASAALNISPSREYPTPAT